MKNYSKCTILTPLLLASTIAGAGFTTTTAVGGDKAKFHWTNNKDYATADLKFGDAPVLRYMYAFDRSTKESTHDTFKVYHHVFGPGTDKIITKGPGGLYTHHRGLFVGWNKTSFEDQTLDFWHCKNGEHLRHAKFLEMKGDAKHGTMTSEIHWVDREGKPVVVETRTVSARQHAETGGWQIDWSTQLVSQRGEIKLDGDRQHAGFQFRAAQAVAEAKNARYVRPTGFPEQPDAYQVSDGKDPNKHVDLGWLAMTFEIDETRFNVEYFEDPSVPHPSRYSERPYGRFGAFFKTKFDAENPLEMRYRLIITAGKTSKRSAIQKRYATFLSELKSK